MSGEPNGAIAGEGVIPLVHTAINTICLCPPPPLLLKLTL